MRRFDPFRPRDALSDAMGVLVPALLLTAIGLICVYSYGSQFAFKQALWAIVGVLSCIAVSRIPGLVGSRLPAFAGGSLAGSELPVYDRRGDLLKTLELTDYRKYRDVYWRAHTMTMVNHATGKSTVLRYGDYDFETDLDENDFQKGVLERLR